MRNDYLIYLVNYLYALIIWYIGNDSLILLPIKSIWNKFHGKIIHIIYSPQGEWLVSIICIYSLISDSDSFYNIFLN